MADLPSGTVTFLFTDIEGSTRLARELGERWEPLRARHHSILARAIDSQDGYVFQIIGDAFCAAFHTAGGAIRAAARAQMDLHTEQGGEGPIKVRMGIHTGRAEVQDSGQYHGYLAMSRIQRLVSAGHGGQVLVSAASQELLLEDLPDGIALRDLGERRLKDLIRPEHIYQLVSAGLPMEFPPLKTLDSYRHNLPTQLTSFVGREQQIEQVKQASLTHRLVTLTGPGGAGKTRLSLQVAAELLDRFPDGVWFVELAPITDPDFIPKAILSAMGIPEQPGLGVLHLLMDYLRDKKLCLILDNCEHLIEASAKLVDALLGSSPSLKIMVTSREALGITGELIWHVPSLSLPDAGQPPPVEQLSQYEAVQLFIERASLVQPQFQVTNANAPALAQICSRLDGIPLAIELAAARVRTLSLEEIASRLDNRFRLLTGGSRTALERHQTLRAAIDWSYNLLSADEKLLLRRLSVFIGDWTLEAAERVCVEASSGLDVLDLLARLVEKSLVILDGSRYHMLETTRQYAREKLLESEESSLLHDRHFACFLDLAERADQQMRGPGQVEWLHRLNPMRDNLRAALEWALDTQQTEQALKMVLNLDWYWFVRGEHTEAMHWLGRVLGMRDAPAYPEAQAEALRQMAHHKWLVAEPGEARPFIDRALALARTRADKSLTGRVWQTLALILIREENFAAAREAMEESRVLFSELGELWRLASTELGLGLAAYIQGDQAASLALTLEGLRLFRQVGDGYFQSVALRFSGNILVKQGDLEKGMANLREALALVRQLEARWEIYALVWTFAESAQASGDQRRAVRLYLASEQMGRSIGAWVQQDNADLEKALAACRLAMEESEFAVAAQEGRSMSMEQAIAYALEGEDPDRLGGK